MIIDDVAQNWIILISMTEKNVQQIWKRGSALKDREVWLSILLNFHVDSVDQKLLRNFFRTFFFI